MILSYNPLLRADAFRLCGGREADAEDESLMARASAVLLPQGRHPDFWEAASRRCSRVFPNYGPRYEYPGKSGDIRLFRHHKIPHPDTRIFDRASDCPDAFWDGLEYPTVIKSNAGGEGRLVFFANGPGQAREAVARLQGMESSGISGFVVQELIETGGRTLRVVVMDRAEYTYWKVAGDEGTLAHNLAQGAHLEAWGEDVLAREGTRLAREFANRSGIDLAGLDVIFDHGCDPPRPLMLEVNYYFGREGLGGQEGYTAKLQRAVDAWLAGQGLDPPEKEMDEEDMLAYGRMLAGE